MGDLVPFCGESGVKGLETGEEAGVCGVWVLEKGGGGLRGGLGRRGGPFGGEVREGGGGGEVESLGGEEGVGIGGGGIF